MEGLLKGGSLSKDNISGTQLFIQITIIKGKGKMKEKKNGPICQNRSSSYV